MREANIPRINGRYKSLVELNDEEMSGLVTAVMIRCATLLPESLIGNIFLVKFFNKLEDARELSALINACSRMDAPATALGFCLGNKQCKEEAERMYIEYKQHLVAALKYVAESDSKIIGKSYTIINARDSIKDTIIGTVASIISNSPAYTEGTIIVALAYNQDKIKVSARIAGRNGRNVRDVLHRVVVPLGGEVGGHPAAAGGLIAKEKEAAFISELQKALEIEV
jgi:single-stranded DNA-specific DHH superfamily exonuclease